MDIINTIISLRTLMTIQTKNINYISKRRLIIREMERFYNENNILIPPFLIKAKQDLRLKQQKRLHRRQLKLKRLKK